MTRRQLRVALQAIRDHFVAAHAHLDRLALNVNQTLLSEVRQLLDGKKLETVRDLNRRAFALLLELQAAAEAEEVVTS